jgi:HEAT repeat protein
MNLNDKAVLSELKKNYSSYESSLRWDIIEYSKNKDDIEFLLWILENENREGFKSLAIDNLGKIGDPSVLPYLEKLLTQNKIIRNSAKQAIEEIKKNKELNVQQ